MNCWNGKRVFAFARIAVIQKLRHECGTAVFDFAALGRMARIGRRVRRSSQIGMAVAGELTAFIFSADGGTHLNRLETTWSGNMKRSIIFIGVLIFLAALSVGLGYFQFVVKPGMIKSFILAAAPPPTSVAVATARSETWTPRLPAIGSLRAVQEIEIAPQIGGAIVAVRVKLGQDVEKGAPLFEIDNSVEQADLKNNLAVLKNADFALGRQRQLIQGGNTAKANFDSAEAARDSAAAAVERVRAIIAQKMLTAPFAGRVGIRKLDLGQYVSPGTGLISLQQLDPIFVDFPVPEKSLGLLKCWLADRTRGRRLSRTNISWRDQNRRCTGCSGKPQCHGARSA